MPHREHRLRLRVPRRLRRGPGARPVFGVSVVAVAALFLGPSVAPPASSALAPAADSQLTIEVTPNPGYVGGTVAVNFVVHFSGADGAIVSFVVYPTLPSGMAASPMPPICQPTTDGGCQLPGSYSTPTTISVPYTLYPSAPGTYTITGQLSELTTEIASEAVPAVRVARAPQDPVSVVLTVLQPSIRVLPPVASPGDVVLVYGRDFPPGSVVSLAWKPGITAAAVSPVASTTGAFVTQLLVIGGDRTGRRTAAASGTGFTAATAPLLVTPNRLMPPLLGAGRPAGTPR